MSTDHDVPPGRPIVLTPVPQGLWLVISGAVIAILAPLFGFLIGTMMGDRPLATFPDTSPIYVFLVLGILVGGVGMVILLLGVARLWKNRSKEPS
ncbi:MAG TPA: hypothetical protein PLT68_07435 [Actinomycetota bacterium]|nr:hypothetical protein [Actinomycetota bacterium]